MCHNAREIDNSCFIMHVLADIDHILEVFVRLYADRVIVCYVGECTLIDSGCYIHGCMLILIMIVCYIFECVLIFIVIVFHTCICADIDCDCVLYICVCVCAGIDSNGLLFTRVCEGILCDSGSDTTASLGMGDTPLHWVVGA